VLGLALCQLVVDSTKLDRFGLVSSDIPDVLNTVLHCLFALEHKFAKQRLSAFTIEASALMDGKDFFGDLKREEEAKIRKCILAIKTGVYDIRNAFGEESKRIAGDLPYSKRFDKFISFEE
jgi:hypothetical protein